MNHLQTLAGEERRIPSVVAWRAVRSEIQQAFESVAGAFPAAHVRTPRCSLAPETEEEVDCGSYVRRLISYAALEGGRTPAYLCIPKQCLEEPPVHCPAVLCLHGTDNAVGHGTVVGLSNRENRSYASELAERGFVTIAPSYPLLANYQVEPSDLDFDSGTMMAIWDNVRALDLLDSLPFVANKTPERHQNANGTDLPLDYYEFGNTDDPNSFQPGKYGVIGHSLGGHNSVYTSLFEPRIAAVVSSCGLDSYRDYMDGNVAGWTQTRYLPKLPLDIDEIPFDFHDLVAAVAPRPCLLVAPVHDTNFKWNSVDEVASAARRIYALYDSEDALVVEHPDCGHDFPPEMREMAYALFERVLSTPASTTDLQRLAKL